jgi:hypothetical protein
MTGSRNLDKKATCWCWPQCFGINSPGQFPSFTFTKRWKGCTREGKASIRDAIRICFSSSTYFISLGVQRRRFGPSWANLREKDFVLREYESIHKWQYPSKPRNFLNSYFVPGRGRPLISFILSGPVLHWLLLIKCPRYFTSVSTIVTYFFVIRSLWLPMKFIKLMVVIITSPLLSPHY